MWTFYTKALSISPSAVHVNIVNTTSNFLITAILGALIFGEKLPALWFVGAVFLVTGGVIIGRREETSVEEVKKKAL
jgi:drug/metabolite transporter (DMT)-like permease